jgi:opacity protein-like surface antigen
MNRCLVALLVLAAPAAFAADVKETVHVVITGGAHAGTYNGSTDRGGCSAGMTGRGSFGNQYSLPKENDPKVLNSVQVIVPNAKAAGSGTDLFFLNVAFGRVFKRDAEYKVDTQKKSGTGTITVHDKGSTAEITFDAKTADGVHLVGTIDCKSVTRGE